MLYSLQVFNALFSASITMLYSLQVFNAFENKEKNVVSFCNVEEDEK
jgi:hypothetical protein